MVQTQYPGHATQIMAQLDLQSADMVAFAGGDGTVNEGVQVGGWRGALGCSCSWVGGWGKPLHCAGRIVHTECWMHHRCCFEDAVCYFTGCLIAIRTSFPLASSVSNALKPGTLCAFELKFELI